MGVDVEEEENYNENKFVFSRANEKLTHSKIRELVEQGQNFKRESKNGLAHILGQLLKLPNLPVYLLYHWVEKTKVSQVAFISSIKLVTGMLIFPLWLLLSFIFGGLILGWNIGAYIVVLQVIAVLLRRWIVPYSYATEA